MATVIRALKNIYKAKFQKGNRIQIPLELVQYNKLYHGQPIELQVVEKGTTISDSGILIRFVDESRGM